MKNIPDKIYLQIGDNTPKDVDFKDLDEVTWCAERISKNDIEFVSVKKAIEAHRKLCPYLDDEICAGQSDVVTSSRIDEKCLGKCEYVELFKSLINNKS